MKRLLVCFLLATGAGSAAPVSPYAQPRFDESPSQRRTKIAGVIPEIDAAFRTFASERHAPSVVWGIVLDGELVHTGATGLADIENKRVAQADTRFRIASMSKSFTAMAVVKLRDAGKLTLDDAVAKYLPEFKAVSPLTADSPPVTIWHLLTMTAGFPEDNPWGDRQLAVGVQEFADFIRGGVALSNPPGVAFEYSNFAFALLGQIVSRVSGEPYQTFITREILRPLGMKDTVWEYTEVPPDKLAHGYRWEDNAWRPEPMLHDGTYGAMGGLLTTLNDFARYVSFHLSAWPPRDDAEAPVLRRSTLREMHRAGEFTGLTADARNLTGRNVPTASGYGFGLGWTIDSDGVFRVGHSGGLPGFGSNYRFYPEHGIGIISFANLTYAGTGVANVQAGGLLIERAQLPRRRLPASAMLSARKDDVVALLRGWNPQLAERVVAENFFLDHSRAYWAQLSQAVLQRIGGIKSVGELVPENQLRGTFQITGDTGVAEVFFTLTPEKTARLQQLRLTPVR